MIAHPALFQLIYLRLRGRIKHLLLSLRSPKKAIFSIVTFLLICLWFASQIIPAMMMPSKSEVNIQPYIPFGLLALTLLQLFTSATERAVMFQQNEIDFLFPAPFTRKQLLLFKIVTSLVGVIFSSVIFTFIMMRFIDNMFMAFMGFFLAMTAMHLLSMAAILLKQTVDQTFYNRIWQVGMYIMLATVVYLGWEYRMVVIETGIKELIFQLYENPYVYIFLAPFDVFGFLITTQSWLMAILIWLPLAVLINCMLLLLVFQLDANYLEVSLNISQKMHKRVEQMRKGGTVFVSKKSEATKPFRMFPRWGGTGTIAWRQYIQANRNLGSWLFTLLLLGAASVCAYFFSQSLTPSALIWVVFGCLLYFSIFVTQYIRYDFRSDLDQFDWLKQLPMDSAAIATGEIIVPVVFLTLLEGVTFSLPFFLRGEFIYWIYLVLLILPFNIFLVGVDNFVFLLFPTRMYKAQGDFGMIGKMILLMLLKFLILAAIFIVAVGMGFLMYWLSGYIDAVLFLTTWAVALLETLMVIPALAWAFDRFDVSSDIPPA